jgi:mannosyltransferase
VSTLTPPRPVASTPAREAGVPLAPRAVGLLLGAVLVVAVVLRFVTVSDLWLDEAQSVAIATEPTPAAVLAALREDGAPPLYYLLLAGWTSLFGTSDLAVRSLSGLASVAALPLVWALGRRLGGPTVGTAALLLLATNPFAIRYATETRMYALLVLLTAAAGLALLRVLDRPGRGAQAGLAVLTGLLLLTHYWALFLVATVGGGLLLRAWRGPRERRAAALRATVAVAAGALAFLPWLPVFLFQMQHTGAPWAAAVHPRDLVDVVGDWAMDGSFLGSLLALLLAALVVLGLAGRPGEGRSVVVELRALEPGRTLGLVVAVTLVVAFLAGLTGSAFASRYTSVVLVPGLLLMALGFRAFGDRRVRMGVLAAVVLLGLAGGVEPALAQRTQAGEVAEQLQAMAGPGDVVAYCPDQLGPAVSRVLGDGAGLRQVVYPTGAAPGRVGWVDYAERNQAADGEDFARRLDELAGGSDVWLVWMTGYRTFGRECTDLAEVLEELRPDASRVVEMDRRLFEPMQLVRYPASG